MYHTKNDKRSKDSSERLYRALCTLSRDKDFDKISIVEIIKEAQVARATFYRNFDYLEDILHYQVDLKMTELDGYLRKYFEKDNLAPDDAFLMIPFLNFWYHDSSLIELLIKFNKMNIIKKALTVMLNNEIKSFLRDAYNEEVAGYMLAIRVGIFLNTLEHWVNNGKTKKPKEIMKRLMDNSNKDEFFGKSTYYDFKQGKYIIGQK